MLSEHSDWPVCVCGAPTGCSGFTVKSVRIMWFVQLQVLCVYWGIQINASSFLCEAASDWDPALCVAVRASLFTVVCAENLHKNGERKSICQIDNDALHTLEWLFWPLVGAICCVFHCFIFLPLDENMKSIWASRAAREVFPGVPRAVPLDTRPICISSVWQTHGNKRWNRCEKM